MIGWHDLSIEQAFNQLDSKPDGLTDFESVMIFDILWHLDVVLGVTV